jgi:3-oxoacyl-[acyl-carrier protein] reductase
VNVPRDLEGKTAVVTGSSRRIGRSIALRLAQAGANVVINAKASAAKAEAVASEIKALGVGSIAIMADIIDPDAVKAMAEKTVETFGGVDILVNTVALRRHTPLPQITLAEWREVLSSALDGTFLCSQAFAPHLIARKGWIVNIGGASAHFGQKNQPHVMTAKMGIVGLTRSLAIDLGPDVVVNCLIPGRVDGPEDRRAATPRYPMERIPAGRPGTLEEVAEAVAMLCNPRCRFINGQSVHISGGMLFGI